MYHIVTRKEEELQTLKTFIENLGEEFNLNLIDYSHSEPCDVAYNGIQYQITVGDQKQLAKKRKDIQKSGQYLIVRSVGESNDPTIIVDEALKKKVIKSSEMVNLLIDCTSSADYPSDKREEIFKNYISKNKGLMGLWKGIFLVFRGQNIRLMP